MESEKEETGSSRMSPTVFWYKNYRFFFFSREEIRIHVHVTCPEGEAKFWLEPVVALADFRGLNARRLREIQKIVEASYKIECDLRKEIAQNIKRLKEIGSWRGSRHARKLPIKGRTKTNSRTTRGNVRKTMGSGRKPAASPT